MKRCTFVSRNNRGYCHNPAKIDTPAGPRCGLHTPERRTAVKQAWVRSGGAPGKDPTKPDRT